MAGNEAATDALGHGLLRRRVASAWPMARSLLHAGPLAPWRPLQGGVVATGVGSSEAHARYLAGLLRRFAGVPAWFEPLSAFLDPCFPARHGRDQTLVVFSQGLGPNAQIALERRGEFGSVVLATSATEEGQRNSGRDGRAEWIARLRGEGARVEWFPVEDEYTILVRVIGPLCGMAAAWRLAASVPGHGLTTGTGLADRLDAWSSAPWPGFMAGTMHRESDQHRAGFTIVTGEALGGCAQNVVAKFVEGLYWRGPRVVDVLGLAHGPLQQLVASPEPVWVLGDDAMARRAFVTLREAGLSPRQVMIPSSFEQAPLAAEILFNHVLLDMVESLDVDQLNWPGKGRDAGLYGISRREDVDETGGA